MTAADAFVGFYRSTEEPDQGSGADEGVRRTMLSDFKILLSIPANTFVSVRTSGDCYFSFECKLDNSAIAI